jgi:hypothetical protein
MVFHLVTGSGMAKPQVKALGGYFVIIICYHFLMSDLSQYRAKLKRLIEAEDIEEALIEGGFSDFVAEQLRHNKAFHASRSVQAEGKHGGASMQLDKMSQRQVKR